MSCLCFKNDFVDYVFWWYLFFFIIYFTIRQMARLNKYMQPRIIKQRIETSSTNHEILFWVPSKYTKVSLNQVVYSWQDVSNHKKYVFCRSRLTLLPKLIYCRKTLLLGCCMRSGTSLIGYLVCHFNQHIFSNVVNAWE